MKVNHFLDRRELAQVPMRCALLCSSRGPPVVLELVPVLLHLYCLILHPS